MQTIVLATKNKHKLKEFREVLTDYQVISLEEIGYLEDIPGIGETFLENALIKAKTISQYLQEKGLTYIVVSEDSGLCVDTLNGEPGFSARYAGFSNNASLNREKLLKKLEERGKTDFGYDCLFYSYDLKKTLAKQVMKKK